MNSKKTHPHIAICLATYKRPQLLKQLLLSFLRMHTPAGVQIELRIVDNDEAETGKSVVNEFRKQELIFSKIHYRIQKSQNIAMARNTGLDIGPADCVVFVDDDEEVSSQWLAELWKTYQNSKADGVFGPVKARFAKNTPAWIIDGGFMEKILPKSGTTINWKDTRTSNTLIKGKWFYGATPYRFDTQMGRSGGSDTNLFSIMESNGAKYVSCTEAEVSEIVPSSRATFKWLWNRRFRNGLIYERIAARNPNERHPLIRFIRRLASALLISTKGAPEAFLGRPAQIINGLLQIPLAIGGLICWLKPTSVSQHVAYEKQTTDSEEPSVRKIAFLTNIISPYRAPIFKRLADRPDWDFRVIINAKNEFDRSWNTDKNGIPTIQTRTWSWKRKVISKAPVYFEQIITLHFPYALFRDLQKFRPHAIISHELGFRTAIAAAYCAIFRIPLIIWAYQSRVSSSQGSWRLYWRKWILGRAQRVVGMGTQAREVLQTWGVPPNKIIDAPNAADHISISQSLKAPDLQDTVDVIRNQYAKQKSLAIVVGRLVPLKGIDYILSSWKQLPESTRKKWNLVFLGDGPLENRVKEAGDDSVHMAGFVSTEQMTPWYCAADLHIFPTCGDVWGLVVNEASACGTPSLCSIHAGCSDDLIASGFNGLSIDLTNTDSASEDLDAALNRNDLPYLGLAALQHIERFTLDKLASGFSTAIHDTFTKRNDTYKELPNRYLKPAIK